MGSQVTVVVRFSLIMVDLLVEKLFAAPSDVKLIILLEPKWVIDRRRRRRVMVIAVALVIFLLESLFGVLKW